MFIYVDYTLPVETLRTELQRILQESKLWNGKMFILPSPPCSCAA
jgi:hypothetical protein